jgi:hypothetical protein
MQEANKSAGKEPDAKRAKKLAAELTALSRQQFKTLETATFIGLSKDQDAECNRRGRRIREIFRMLDRRPDA